MDSRKARERRNSAGKKEVLVMDEKHITFAEGQAQGQPKFECTCFFKGMTYVIADISLNN